MSYLEIDVAIDFEATHAVWAADVARKLRAVADEVEHAAGAIRVKVEWPDLEGWPEPWQPGARPDVPAWSPVGDQPEPGG